MKGKLKLSLRIVLTVAMCLFASVCFVGLEPAIKAKKELPAFAIATLDGKDYSALLGGDVVLSVEKVAVDEYGDYIKPIVGDNVNTFYGRAKDVFEYKSGSSEQIKSDLANKLPIIYIKDNAFVSASSAADVDANASQPFYMGNVSEISSSAAVDKFNENVKLCYIKNNRYNKVENLKNIEDNSSCKFYIIGEVSDVPYYFQDIYQDNKSKQVVEDGQFVMLNNKNVGGTYINSQTSQADAIIISLGQYVYFEEEISTTKASGAGADVEYSQITNLSVSLTHNGEDVSGLTYRNITTTDGNIPFFDFMCMITEDGVKNIEGHYVLTTNYIKGGIEYSADFDFYLVCESTYTRTKVVGGQTYTSAPVLGWTENGIYEEKLPNADGYVHYNEGINGLNKSTTGDVDTISYPTITYDYTKYQLSYELTANRTIKKYELNYQIKPNTEVEMVCSVSGAEDDEKSFKLTNYNRDLKLVTVVFTEQGNYNFSFKYLYTGADSKNAPTMDRLKIENKKLSIHGVDLNYSKQDYTGAQFRKFNFATNVDAEVNLIIPNGYEQTTDEKNIEKYKNQDLPLMYSVNRENLSVAVDKNIRVGEVVLSKASTGDRTEDTLQNFNFDLQAGVSTNVEIDDFVQYVLDIDNYEDIDTSTENTYYDNDQFKLSDYKLEYIKTNQGSMWLSYTDKIIETKDGATVDGSGSFYFYSRNQIVEDSFVIKDSETKVKTGIAAKPYNNQTSFNQVGYYLVFVKIDSKSDTYGTEGTGDDFWQVYAFQYMSDTIDIEVKTTGAQEESKNNVNIGAGKYTKENVVISWKEPETFETKIVAKYYKVTNSNATRDELLKTSSFDLVKDTQVLGTDVENGQFAKYLIKLDRAGKSATYKIFTIDRQPISGVAAYAIKTRASKSAVYYEFATKNGNPITILNGITNSYSTIGWNKKDSGAQINCKYSYTPFVVNSSATSKIIKTEKQEWFTTNYKLGKTINNCELEEVASRANVGYDSVLFGQGIYVFTITDEAGNATKYMLVIDNTEAYLQIDDGSSKEILPNGGYRLYGKNISYSTGSHKAISLDFVADDVNELGDSNNGLINYILNKNLASYEDRNGVKFFRGDNSAYINQINKLFSEFSTKKYIIVENQKVVAYDGFSIDIESSAYSKPPFGQIVFDRDKLNGATSMNRILYIVGSNMLYSASYNDNSPNESISYVKVEINKDNARGMVYYGNTSFDISKIPQNGEDGTNVKRLQTGSDYTNKEGKEGKFTTGVNGAHATKDKFAAFTWLVGEDKFTVKKVSYQYYELNLKEYNAYDPSEIGSGKYFYKANGGEITLYDGVAKDPSVIIQDGRGFFLFKTNYDYTTKAGLYVVTRYYAIDPEDPNVDPPVDYGDDTYCLTYYFIVDRNGIHDVTNDIGNYISIGLLNGETGISGDKFSLISTNPVNLQYDKNNDGIFDVVEKYYLYFSTNRVPAILNIPTGKYFKEEKVGDTIKYYSSNAYYAGQLRLSIYYQDIYNQINGEFVNTTYKIFEKNVPTNGNYYSVNLLEYLTSQNEENLIKKLIVNDGEGKSWLHLKGRYVVVIEDNVETSSTLTNKKIIGFDIIKEKYPEAEIKIGGTKVEDEMTKVVADNKNYGKFSVMTNQEFVRVELPLYDEKNVLAQVDNQYILVKQNFNNSGEIDYIKSEYGTDIVGKLEGEFGKKRFVYLNTLLRDEKTGRILTENFNKPLYYTVTIRYQIGEDVKNKEIYKDCYVYYTYPNGVETKNYYYTSTYTITIDRLAPTENVKNLRENDILIEKGYANAEFETDYYEESQMYFTYQYADYYNNGKNLSDIHMFRVTEETLFSKDDVSSLYVSNVYSKEDLKTLSLNLPIVSFAGFMPTKINTISDYGNVFGKSYGYYQVLEVDKAGNVTQYLVYYSPLLDEETGKTKLETLSIPVNYQSTIGEPVDFVIGNNNNVSTIELFSIMADGEVRNSDDYFFYVSLKDSNNAINDSWQPLSITTNLATLYSGEDSLANKIVNSIKSRKGSYELSILSRTGNEYKLGISVYSEDDKIDLNIEKLIENHNGKYYINLRGANAYYNNNMFYAKEITVTEKIEGESEATTKRYVCRIENGQYNYYWDNYTLDDLSDDEFISGAILACEENATYKLSLIDVFGGRVYTRFNTAGKEFYTIKFDDFGKYYINEQGHYYAYSNATITFDGIFKIGYGSDIEVKINNTVVTDISQIPNYVKIEGNSVTINKIYNENTGEGAVLNVILQFREVDNSLDREFNITIDTTSNSVNLKDYTTGDNKSLKLYNNIKLANNIQTLKQYKPQDVTSGIMNLSWTKENKEYYSYSYQLFELKKDDRYTDGLVQEIELSNTNYVIDTQEDSFGVYWFIINIMSPDGEVLGNKIYAFEVQAVNNNLYYVKNKDGLAINANSIFNKSDIETLINAGAIFKFGSLTGTEDNTIINKLPTTNLPLYITNHKLDVVLTENVTSKMFIASIDLFEEQTLTIYEIDANTYQLYFGILQIPETSKLVKKESISGISVGASEFVTFVNNPNHKYTLIAERTQDLTNILAKNTLLLDVFYNGEIVKTVVYKENLIFEILGNGSYSFKIRDLAGNEHVFENGTDMIETLILREVAVTINDQAPIENAYYNGEVSLKVFAATKYVTGSISVTAERNGVPYQVSSSNPYIFKDYGTYVVKVKAVYKDTEGVNHELFKTLTFSIINVEEVRTAIDLTNLKQHTITKVTNPNGVDITNAFMQMINNKTNAMLIKHDEIMENADALQVSAGKLLFTVEYLVNDGIYPNRTLQVQFTLNNEKPVINCSLGIGESTKKEFSISFNPGIIFEQIGESYIYINDEIAYTINSSSPSGVVELMRSFKENGAGDYYIKLVGTSGNVWHSFKVEIKEPLNTGAIIIIVVVVAIVATVVITIIVLRRKMRIR